MYSQIRVHLLKGTPGLLEEIEDDTLAEIALVVVVHLQDLLKSRSIDHLGRQVGGIHLHCP